MQKEKKRALVLRPFDKLWKIDDVLITLLIRTGAQLVNLINYDNSNEIIKNIDCHIVSVPVFNLFECTVKQDRQIILKKPLLKKFVFASRYSRYLKFLCRLAKIIPDKKYYGLLSVVNAYTNFDGQTRKNSLQLNFQIRESLEDYNRMIENIIDIIQAEGFFLRHKKGYYFLGTESMDKKNWEKAMGLARSFPGINSEIIDNQLDRGYSWVKISQEGGKRYTGIAELVLAVNF